MKDDFKPQFEDGSGWDKLEDIPYFYEHISPEEGRKLELSLEVTYYKVITVVPLVEQLHKNTYFVKGKDLESFLEGFSQTAEYIVSIEKVDKIPSAKEKLRNV